MGRSRNPKPAIVRLMERVAKRDSGCWEWTGCIVGGYGQMRDDAPESRVNETHRIAWRELRGPIPPEFTIDHLCENKICVNQDHLEPVTSAENISRYWAKRFRQCVHGTKPFRQPGRHCPQCNNERVKG